MSNEITKEEARDNFLNSAKAIAFYWSNADVTKREACDGVVFSLMNIFDGTSGSFPCAIDLILRPHPDDKQYHIDEEEDYISDGMCINDDVHLHGMLNGGD